MEFHFDIDWLKRIENNCATIRGYRTLFRSREYLGHLVWIARLIILAERNEEIEGKRLWRSSFRNAALTFFSSSNIYIQNAENVFESVIIYNIVYTYIYIYTTSPDIL